MKKTIMSIILFMLICLLPVRVHASGVQDSHPNAKIYDVTTYGADASGNTSSDTAISKTIAAAKNDLRKGNMDGKQNALIYFPKGTYKANSDIRIYEGMHLYAEGAVLQAALSPYSGNGYVIEGGTWKGPKSGQVIKLSSVKNASIKNLRITSGFIGIGLYNSTAVIENVTVSGCQSIGTTRSNAINISSKSTATIKNSTIKNNESFGIGIYSSSASMEKVTVSGCKNIGINVSRASNAVIKNSTITNNGSGYPKKGYLGQGIGVYSDSKLKISGSKIFKNKECGISAVDGDVNASSCSLSDNGRHAIGTAENCNIVMNKCDIYHNGYIENLDGVSIVKGSIGKFTSCKFRSNAAAALLVNHGGSSAVLKKCVFSGNQNYNIYSENLDKKPVTVTIDSCTFNKPKKIDSIRFYANSKSAFKLITKGKNVYNVSPKVTYRIKDKITYKK